MTAQQSATEAQCPTAQQSVSSTAQQITTYTKLPNRVCPKAFVQHKSNFKSKSYTICPTLKSPPWNSKSGVPRDIPRLLPIVKITMGSVRMRGPINFSGKAD